MRRFKKLVSIVVASALITSSLAFSISANAAGTSADSAVSSELNTQEKTEDGVILHAFNWSYNSIKANLPQIAAAGYSTVQTSPVTQPKNYGMSSDVANQWWKLYQPVSFSIAQSSWLGTSAELKDLCTEADKYGIKIIVDIVANHMANNVSKSGSDLPDELGSEVEEYEPDIYNNYSTYFHSEKGTADDTMPKMVLGHVSACPDLNTSNSTVQEKILGLLKQCIDCGVDGFRFDAAKHIETEKDGTYASDFWKNTLDKAKEYYKSKNGGKELFAYGEILNTISGRDVSGYTDRMRVTENRRATMSLRAWKRATLQWLRLQTTSFHATPQRLFCGRNHTIPIWAARAPRAFPTHQILTMQTSLRRGRLSLQEPRLRRSSSRVPARRLWARLQATSHIRALLFPR